MNDNTSICITALGICAVIIAGIIAIGWSPACNSPSSETYIDCTNACYHTNRSRDESALCLQKCFDVYGKSATKESKQDALEH